MKMILFLCSILVSGYCSAQKDTNEIIDASGIKSITIDTDEVYLIRIYAVNTSQIKIITHSEGEYFNDIILHTTQLENSLKINTKYPEKLIGGYDKLSAHKVFSLEVELEIPEGMEVMINSNIASLEGSGEFKSIHAGLKQGYCSLKNFSGAAIINTFSGNILVETGSGSIIAQSRNGSVEKPEFLPGGNSIKLTSIDGDIKVRKN